MIGVVNYGMGNIYSVVKAIEYLGYEVFAADKPDELIKAEKVILPGVGAFGAAMKNLESTGLKSALNEMVIKQKKPFLGICLGMQLLGEVGYEYGEHKGLGWISGEVVKLEAEQKGLKIPHIGWNKVRIVRDNPLFERVKDESDFYFVHSYQLIPKNPNDLIATTDYGQQITAAVWHDNIFATQFHPEKSQDVGLKVLENFINWSN